MAAGIGRGEQRERCGTAVAMALLAVLLEKRLHLLVEGDGGGGLAPRRGRDQAAVHIRLGDRDLPSSEQIVERGAEVVATGGGTGAGEAELVVDSAAITDPPLAVEDHDVVLVPRGYHPVVVPYGYESYYLNTMAGPTREWHFRNDPQHEWMLKP